MLRKCVLETDGYQILFDFKSVDSKKEYIDAVVEFQIDSRLGDILVKSVPTFLAIGDLPELVKYFELHIARLQKDPDSESHTFVTWELGFQVQAFSGEVRSPDDGEFSLRFMVNVGQSHEESSRTFVGGEAMVTLEQINRFKSSLQTALTEIATAELQEVAI